MQYHIIPVTAAQQNCTILWCEQSKQAAIIDPGGNPEAIKSAVNKLNVTIEKVLLTHGHLDHVGAAKEIAAYYQVKIIGPSKEDEMLFRMLLEQCQMFNFPLIQPFLPDEWLTDGDEITIGKEALQVIHCPGHAPGHVVYYMPQSKLISMGDVLFAGSVGRTDLPGGNVETLKKSIEEKLFRLPDDTTFIAGHGPMSTLGEEKRSNPFVGVNGRQH